MHIFLKYNFTHHRVFFSTFAKSPVCLFSVFLYLAMKTGWGWAVKSVHGVKSTAILHFCFSIQNATLQVAGAYNLCGGLLIIVDTVKGKQSELHSRCCCSRHGKAERATFNYEVKHNATNSSYII